jgi:hypothetical protein
VAHICILATQEAEITRIAVQSQPWANSSYLENTQNKKQKERKKRWWSGSSGRVPA